MAPAAARAAPKKKTKTFVQKRGQVFKRVLGSLFSWLPRCRLQQLFRKNRAPRGRRGNRVPANGGHVEPEPDVANNTSYSATRNHAHPAVLGRVNSIL
ncbi:hypothetical protein BDA96_10G095500 [Sorghum bicolor]|uniref:Uncharacterized protein n=1 Tax=Sorghum bicolor TaxID=4558 RepID=A0A921Q0C1_SORBI|nr:hypothetical protein BDA96_10G095500 [Sorghum bicolor]